MQTEKPSRLEEFLSNPRKALWQLAVPVMAGMSLHTAYMLADLYFVGKVSSQALAALAFNMPLVFLAIGIVFGLGTGVTSVIARFIGAGDKRRADSAAEHAVVLGILLSILFTTSAYYWGESFLNVLGVPDELLPMAWGYFRVVATGYVFLVMSVFFRSILSGEGDMKTPMMIQGSGTVLNIILDPIFIFYFDMGVQGAALATVISQAMPTCVFVYLLFFREHAYITFKFKNFHCEYGILKSVVLVGMPASFSFIVMAIGGIVFNRILIEYSEDTVSAFQVGTRIDHVFLLPVIAMGAGLMTLVGMFQGAKRIELAREIILYTTKRSLLVAILMGGFFYVYAPQVLSVFTDNPVIAEIGVGYLRISVFSYPFIAIVMLVGRALQGAGFGSPVLVLSLMRVVLISGPLGYFFVFFMEKPVEWVWIAIVAGMVVTACASLVWLKYAFFEQKTAS